MANASTFVVGLGGGLGLWYLTRSKDAPAPAAAATTTASSTPTAPASATAPAAPVAAPRNCALSVDPSGVTIDGARVDVAEAVRRCEAAEHVAVSVARNAPAATYAELMTALGARNLASVRNVRNARGATPKTRRRDRRRDGNASSTFTLAIYPDGTDGATKRVRWFRADPPTTWESARDRLIAARILDPRAVGPGMAGYWKLTTEPRAFRAERAEPLPELPQPMRGAARTAQRYTREGRTILRDGEAILYVDRVDLGDQRYAVSPHEADQLTARLVRLLNRRGER